MSKVGMYQAVLKTEIMEAFSLKDSKGIDVWVKKTADYISSLVDEIHELANTNQDLLLKQEHDIMLITSGKAHLAMRGKKIEALMAENEKAWDWDVAETLKWQCKVAALEVEIIALKERNKVLNDEADFSGASF